jgi:predicted protein tyrosine phosphatase
LLWWTTSARFIKKENIMRVEIYSLYQAAIFSQVFDEKHIIISIVSPYREGTPFKDNPNRLDILRLYFYDIDSSKEESKVSYDDLMAQYGSGVFTEEQAQQIIDFVEKYKDQVELIVVHCEAGISRSAGVGAAILKQLTGDDSFIFNDNRFLPNMFVYRTLLNTWNKEK